MSAALYWTAGVVIVMLIDVIILLLIYALDRVGR